MRRSYRRTATSNTRRVYQTQGNRYNRWGGGNGRSQVFIRCAGKTNGVRDEVRGLERRPNERVEILE